MGDTNILADAIAPVGQPIARPDDIGASVRGSAPSIHDNATPDICVLAARLRSLNGGSPSFEPTPVFTDQLDFTSDAAGYLCNSQGLYLVGPCSSARSGQLEPIRLVHAHQMPTRPTRLISYDANLPTHPVAGTAPIGGGSLKALGEDGEEWLVMLRWTMLAEARRGAASVWRLGYLMAGRADHRHIRSGWQDLDHDFGFTHDGRLLPPPAREDAARPARSVPRFIELTSGRRGLTLEITGLTRFPDSSGLVTIRELAHDGMAAGTLSQLVITGCGAVLAHYSNGVRIKAGTALTSRNIEAAQGAA